MILLILNRFRFLATLPQFTIFLRSVWQYLKHPMLAKSASPSHAAAAAANPSTRDATPTDLGGEAAAQIPQLDSEMHL